ncbi:MAG: hypothetical protein M1826_006528 [Phylliscum demangeonii]|nr:MAG: hypothetical protein M1826_006528 [Phylliscum demangeonii]
MNPTTAAVEASAGPGAGPEPDRMTTTQAPANDALLDLGTSVAPPALSHEPIEVDNAWETDDSAYGDSSVYSSSLLSEMTDYKYENGRRYHSYQEGRYLLPNDEREADREHMKHHMLSLITSGRLHLAPISPRPQRILDVGTGTGIWALQIADEYPSAEVLGIDLSAHQSRWIPPNLRFQVDDAEAEWLHQPGTFDLVHMRHMFFAIRDYPKVLEQAKRALKVGGWIELCELDIIPFSRDNTLPRPSKLVEFFQLLNLCGHRMGFNVNVALNLRQLALDAGYENVTEEILEIPSTGWPKDRRLKEAGVFHVATLREGLQAIAMAPLTRVLGWTSQEVEILVASVRAELDDRSIHSSVTAYERFPLPAAAEKHLSSPLSFAASEHRFARYLFAFRSQSWSTILCPTPLNLYHHFASQPSTRPRSGAPLPPTKWDGNEWELTVGLEIHAQLNTDRKLFSGSYSLAIPVASRLILTAAAATSTEHLPNSHVSVFDAALPGSQPQFQARSIIPALRAALALGCQIQASSQFDRKHYFYRDQPAGYQITQYYEPFALGGQVKLYEHDGIATVKGQPTVIDLKQIQLEQDTAKSTTAPPCQHLLDLNRVSYPLIEIVTLPQIHHPATAAAFVKKVQRILKSVNACVLGMEHGGLRTDVNVSVRRYEPISDDEVAANSLRGQRTEIKNLTSIKAIEDAIEAEALRQIALIEAGGEVAGETRRWALGGEETKKLRSKEGEVDYRYLPDADLGPLRISEDLVSLLKQSLPMTADDILEILMNSPLHNLSVKDARTLIVSDDGQRLEFYEATREKVLFELDEAGLDPAKWHARGSRTTANWVLHELGGLLSASGLGWDQNPIPSNKLASILVHLLRGQITGKAAKGLLATALRDPRSIQQIIQQENLRIRPMSNQEYDDLASAVMHEHESLVRQLRVTPKASKTNFLVGQMIRREPERVEAVRAEKSLLRLLPTPELPSTEDGRRS